LKRNILQVSFIKTKFIHMTIAEENFTHF